MAAQSLGGADDNNGKEMKQVFIGTSGWSYKSWEKGFYPPKITAANRLQYYATQFSTVGRLKALRGKTGVILPYVNPKAVSYLSRYSGMGLRQSKVLSDTLTAADGERIME